MANMKVAVWLGETWYAPFRRFLLQIINNNLLNKTPVVLALLCH
jgi:hypothetical protein